MASQDSANTPDLIVGSLVSFTSAGDFYEGTVYVFDPKEASFGIDDVSRTRLLAGALSNTRLLSGNTRLEGQHQFFLKDIEDLRVIRVPSPKPTTNTTEDDQKTTPEDDHKTTPEDDQNTTPEDDQNTTPEDDQKATPEDDQKTTPEDDQNTTPEEASPSTST